MITLKFVAGLTMGLSLVISYLITGASLVCVSGNNRGSVIACNNTAVKLTAHPGDAVRIQCKELGADTIHLRHFCREVENSDCTDLISAKNTKVTTTNKYSLLNDQKGVYTVVIRNLTLEDEGTYRCVVEREMNSGSTCLTQIQLQMEDWDDITSTEKIEASGNTVQIAFNYSKSYENNEKFLCKGKTPFTCETLIQTTKTERHVQKGKFMIRDNQRLNSFYVHISNLSTDDSGTYWCGSDLPSHQAEFNKLLLTVVDKKHIKTQRSDDSDEDNRPRPERDDSDDSDEDDPPRPERDDSDDSDEDDDSDSEKVSSGKDAGWIGGLVVGLLLLIVLVVLVLVRRKLPRPQVCCACRGSSVHAGQNTEGNHEPDYAEIQDQQASSGHALSTIYATIEPPADQLHYASINTHKDSVSTSKDALPDTNINHCDYTYIMTQSPVHPPETEQTVSTVSVPGEP